MITEGPELSNVPAAVNYAKLAAAPKAGGAWPHPTCGETSSAATESRTRKDCFTELNETEEVSLCPAKLPFPFAAVLHNPK